MRLSRREIERASELQSTSVAAWYLAVGFLLVMLGGLWFVFADAWTGIDAEQDTKLHKAAVGAASRKAAARDAQSRLAAQQEARDLATDSARAPRPAPEPTPTASPDPAVNAKEAVKPQDPAQQ